MQLNRDDIIATIEQVCREDSRVYALWLEGSDGLGLADDYSDIDLWMDAVDGEENHILDLCVAKLSQLAPPDIMDCYDHPHPQIFQRNLHLAGTSPYLMIDICVQSHSRGGEGCTFIEGDVAEYPKVLFDRGNVVRILPPPPPDLAALRRLREDCDTRYAQRARMTKYLGRGLYLEVFAYYDRYVCQPLVTLCRILHTPRHTEYGLVHVSHHLPTSMVSRLEGLYRIACLADFEANLAAADALYRELQPQLDGMLA